MAAWQPCLSPLAEDLARLVADPAERTRAGYPAEAMGDGVERCDRPHATQEVCRTVWKWHQADLPRISAHVG